MTILMNIRNFLIRKLKTKYENNSTSNSKADSQTDDNIAKVLIKLKYLTSENAAKTSFSPAHRKFKDF